jgi:hypothetical protein
MAFVLSSLPTSIQAVIQQGYLEHKFEQALRAKLGFRAIADREPFMAGIGETITKTRTGVRPDTRVPGNAVGLPTHKVFASAGTIAPGQVLERDVITGQTGLRYQVLAIEWTPVGIEMRAQRMEA